MGLGLTPLDSRISLGVFSLGSLVASSQAALAADGIFAILESLAVVLTVRRLFNTRLSYALLSGDRGSGVLYSLASLVWTAAIATNLEHTNIRVFLASVAGPVLL